MEPRLHTNNNRLAIVPIGLARAEFYRAEITDTITVISKTVKTENYINIATYSYFIPSHHQQQYSLRSAALTCSNFFTT